MGLRIAQTIQRGLLPSLRRPGLTDPENVGEPGADRFAPNYLIVVNGTTLTPDITEYVTSIEYEDNEQLFDQLTISLTGFIKDPVKGREVPMPEFVQSSTIFSEGNIIWVFMGYGSQLQLIGGAEVVRREFNYGQNPSAQIICYEPIHRMANEYAEKGITYKGMRSSDVVKKIGRKGAYSGAIGALFDVSKIERLPIFTPRAEVQKQGQTDWDFLKRLADVRGWDLFTRFDDKVKKFVLLYGPNVDKQAEMFRYTYNPPKSILPEDAILEFQPEINTIDQHAEIEIISIDEKKKKTINQAPKYRSLADAKTQPNRKFTATNTDFKNQELKNPTEYRVKAFGLNKKIVANRPFKDESEAKKFIIQWARNTIKNFITGSGKVMGNETLQSRQVHYFDGLGDTFSGTEAHPGKWYLTKVTHRIQSGGGLTYETSFDARKVIDFLPDDDIRANLPAAESARQAKQKEGTYARLSNEKVAALGKNK